MAELPGKAPRVGVVTHFFTRLRVASVRLEQPVAVGDTLRIRGPRDDLRVRVRSLQVDRAPVQRAAAGQEVGILLPARAHEGAEVLKEEPRALGWLARLLGRGAG